MNEEDDSRHIPLTLIQEERRLRASVSRDWTVGEMLTAYTPTAFRRGLDCSQSSHPVVEQELEAVGGIKTMARLTMCE